MGCPPTGCAPYDYTTKIEVLHNTGEIDSTLQQTPHFTVNGSALDTVLVRDTSYIYYFDTITSTVDSTLSSVLQVILYNDSLNPSTPTDTVYYYSAGYYNMIYDVTGNIIDSIYVSPNNILINNTYIQMGLLFWVNLKENMCDYWIQRFTEKNETV